MPSLPNPSAAPPTPPPSDAPERLAESSNDVGLTGVVFVRDIETHTGEDTEDDSDTVKVAVKANRPLSPPQADIVRDRLLGN